MNVNPFSYLMNKISQKVSKSGDTMSGTLVIDEENGTISTEGFSYVSVGNDKATGTDKNSTGVINLYSNNGVLTQLYSLANSSTKYIALPNKTGTLALESSLVKTVPFSGTTDNLGLVRCDLPSASCKVIGVETNPGYAMYSHETGNAFAYVSIENYQGVKQTGLAVTGTLFYID